MKLSLAQINPIIGDLSGNCRKIADFAQKAHVQGAELVIFPELAVTGYPPQDLLENQLFIAEVQRALAWIAQSVPQDIGIIVGAPVPNRSAVGKRLFNAAMLYAGGECRGEVHKTLLPTYDVFDEHRHFEPAHTREVIKWRGLKLGLHICEDAWSDEPQVEYRPYAKSPLDELVAQGAQLLINISASPFSLDKPARRDALIQNICKDRQLPYVFVNQVGANTEIIFDGDSRVHRADGTRLLCAPAFEEALLFWETDAALAPCQRQRDRTSDLHDALLVGIRDYFYKTASFSKVVVGLSGGIDSAVTCALATEALGPEQVVGVTMPSPYSSLGSVEDSKVLANHLGIELLNIPINPAIAAFDEMLADAFANTEPGVAEENIQARARGVTLMALSNKFNYLLLSSGNKSELAVGYVTLYGDTNGGVAVLSDVLKTQVYDLANHINQRASKPIIPESVISKAPSAELKPGQKDVDALPPYEVLDPILSRYIEGQKDLHAIMEETGCDRALVLDILRRVDRNEYKRRQTPPGFRVTSKAFGIGRRLPIVMRWDRTTTLEGRLPEAATCR